MLVHLHSASLGRLPVTNAIYSIIITIHRKISVYSRNSNGTGQATFATCQMRCEQRMPWNGYHEMEESTQQITEKMDRRIRLFLE